MASKITQKMSLLGYRVEGIEFAIACNHPNGVVLSMNDKRIELNKAQFECLCNLVQQFHHNDTEL